MIDRLQILESHPIVPFLEGRGILLKNGASNHCAMTEHKPGHFCMSVDAVKNVWFCNDCQKGGSVIDFVMLADGLDAKGALEKLGGSNGHSVAQKPANGSRGTHVATYKYVDEDGKLLFAVGRFEPKSFQQKAPDGKGGWIYKLEGVRRVLYNLPEVLAADTVFVCEGEKDCDTMKSLGLLATTNCGGAKKWDKTYTDSLRGKEVCLMPDNDEAGKDHLELLRKELGPAVKSLRIVQMPDGVKDVSDFVLTFSTKEGAYEAVMALTESAEVLFRGQSVPVQTMAELETEYREHLKRASTHQFDLRYFMPTFGYCVRPLVPGEIFALLAGTGVGKTMILQNLALSTNLETLLFEAELPGTLTFERFVGMATNSSGAHVDSTYRMNGSKDWKQGGKLNHISCCHQSNLTAKEVRRIIEAASLKTSRRPVLVLIDYIQLVTGDGSSKYERTSGVAEQLKVVAKETGTIIVIASQINRAATGKDEPREVCLTDGKDSGSIENSAGLVMGAWRDPSDPDRMWLRILKNTKGVPGRTIPCRISESLILTEEAQEPK